MGALAAYVADHNLYPDETAGDDTEGGTYTYAKDVLVPYLDGDPSTVADNSGEGTSIQQYYSFPDNELDPSDPLVLWDPFEEPFWYHNFQDAFLTDPTANGTKLTPAPIYHPHNTRVQPREFQIYTKANFPDDPYNGLEQVKDSMKWVTNYN